MKYWQTVVTNVDVDTGEELLKNQLLNYELYKKLKNNNHEKRTVEITTSIVTGKQIGRAHV